MRALRSSPPLVGNQLHRGNLSATVFRQQTTCSSPSSRESCSVRALRPPERRQLPYHDAAHSALAEFTRTLRPRNATLAVRLSQRAAPQPVWNVRADSSLPAAPKSRGSTLIRTLLSPTSSICATFQRSIRLLSLFILALAPTST